VILDEPTNGLDPLERRAMLGRLVTLAQEHGKTILISTHVLRDVQSICDRLALLVRGRVQLAGSIADLTGSADRDLRLRGAGPLELLLARLAARGIPARLADDGVWEEVGRAGVEAWALEPERRPLEEVFLAALQAADEADAGRLADAPA